jgi:DNA-binding GntR family transcriptional regulator
MRRTHDTDTSRLGPISVSKHVLITRALTDEIQQGRYKVGKPLPSEPELARVFGVSRQTVRVALRNLRELGLITSRQGVGNIVRGNRLGSHFMFTSDSISNQLQYATRTRVSVLKIGEITVDEKLAEWLGCRKGEHWWLIETARQAPDSPAWITYGQIYVPYSFGPALKELGKDDDPMFPLTERLGLPVTEIRQNISAVLMSAAEARILHTTARKPALLVTRHHFDKKGEVLEVTRALHPAHLFSYSMNIQVVTSAHNGGG